MRNDLIRVSLQGDEAAMRDVLEQSGLVEIVESNAEVLVWHLPQDADGLPADLRHILSDPSGPAVLGVADAHPSRWFDEALDCGIDGVVCLPQAPARNGIAGELRASSQTAPRARHATRTSSPCSPPRAARARP
jgi:hypothetical protein